MVPSAQLDVRRQVREAVEAKTTAERPPRTLRHELPDGSIASRFTSRDYTHVTTASGHKAEPLAGHSPQRVVSWHESHAGATRRGRDMEGGGWRNVLVEPINAPPGDAPPPVDPDAPAGSAPPTIDPTEPGATDALRGFRPGPSDPSDAGDGSAVTEAATQTNTEATMSVQEAVTASIEEALSVTEPDDGGDGFVVEASAAAEIRKAVADALGVTESAKTAGYSVTHAPIGKGGTNWITKTAPGNTGQLPAYIQNVRNGIMKGPPPVDESKATEIAIGRIRDWAEGKGNVKPEVRAAAAKAIAEFEAMKGKNDASKATKSVKEAAEIAAHQQLLSDEHLIELVEADYSERVAIAEADAAPGKKFCVKDRAMVTPDDKGNCPKCGADLSKVKATK
jgi:hypothetical protein